MRLRRRRSLTERAANQLGSVVQAVDGRAAKGGLTALGGVAVLTVVSAVVSAIRKREAR